MSRNRGDHVTKYALAYYCCANQIVLNLSCLGWLVLYQQLMFLLAIGINMVMEASLSLAFFKRK